MSQPIPNTLPIGGTPQPIHPGALHAHWKKMARKKGFELIARVTDRYHLALRCKCCGELSSTKLFVLMNARPLCPHCLARRRQSRARRAHLRFLRRDPSDTRYGDYKAPCGHELRRQFGFVERIARGEVSHRCETCQHAREQEEAIARGWELIGPDPEGNHNYRLYRHKEGCGTVTRIARVNMKTGRFDCPQCGECWSAEPSAIYLMRITLAPDKHVVKLGFSRDPESRLLHQLHRVPDLPRQLIKSVPIRSGRQAQRLEKKLHAWLATRFPEGRVPPEEFAHLLKVKSEIYRPELEQPIAQKLDRLMRKERRAASRSRTKHRARQVRLRKVRR